MHVLIVDDSAVVRQTMTAMLATEPDITVSVASDPFIAFQKIGVQRPDVILLDIEMPGMDGLTFLDKLVAADPIPVVICSALAGAQTETALRALQHGAIDVVAKPKIGVREFLNESHVQLVDALRAAAMSRPRRFGRRSFPPPSSAFDEHLVIAIGASTGGTEALRVILSELPAGTPGIVIVQHMPEVFTTHFAQRLNSDSALEIKEAEHCDRVAPGRALIAPGNRHMSLRRDNVGYYVAIDNGPLVSRHRPSVDVLFHSVAELAGERGVGVILTGMGADGADGIVAMKRAGALTIAQDEKTCVVFGMPKEAIARGAIDEVVPLDKIAFTIGRMAGASNLSRSAS